MDVVWFCWTEVVVDRFSMVEVVEVVEDRLDRIVVVWFCWTEVVVVDEVVWLGGIVVVVEVWFGRMVVGMVVVEEVV